MYYEGNLKELCAYWRYDFDWRAQERALNRFNHFYMEIDGLKIHFIHQRPKEATLFLLLLHMDGSDPSMNSPTMSF